MKIDNPKQLFVMMLSNVRQREERMADILKEIIGAAKDPHIKEALESRLFLKGQMLDSLDRCFKLIGEQPRPSTELHEVFLDSFRKELATIESPVVKHLYILAKVKHLVHMHIGEYVALTAMADITKHFGVAMLLEACLAENMALVERTRRLTRRLVEHEIGERLAA